MNTFLPLRESRVNIESVLRVCEREVNLIFFPDLLVSVSQT